MASRTFNTTIVLFWMGTMTWLFVAKVLPPFQVGEPPNYRQILKSDVPLPPVCWSISNETELLGWAASKVVNQADGMTEVHSRVFFAQLPLYQMAPGWLGSVVRGILRDSNELDMDSYSRLEIDPLGRPVAFESDVRLARLRDAIQMRGQIDGQWLNMTVQSGDWSYPQKRYLPPSALLGDEFSPQGRLPGLRIGQTWTEQVYSPLRPPNRPLEVLQATVEREEPIVWNSKEVTTLVVVYRTESGAGLFASREPRGRLWVRSDGTVLKQETAIFNSKLQFVRLPDKKAQELVAALGDNWKSGREYSEAQKLMKGLR